MADPTMQTFCCHRIAITNRTTADAITRLMNEFNSDAYNVVCMFASGLGIAGAIYQILPRQQYANEHRLSSGSAIRGRGIIVWLAIADLLAAIGMLLRAALWLNIESIMPALDDNATVLFCALSFAWTQYFYTATWIWTFCYALDMRRILVDRGPQMRRYHLAAWGIPAATTSAGLPILYLPDAKCHTAQAAIMRVLPNYLATYIPMLTVMIANPCLYSASTKGMEQIVTSCYCQLTGRERDVMDAIRIKFAVINVVFYICWIPNLINGVLLWCLSVHLPVRLIIIIWYIMAFTNPLQALFNCLVYRRWSKGSEKVVFPWKRTHSLAIHSNDEKDYCDEKFPLLKQ